MRKISAVCVCFLFLVLAGCSGDKGPVLEQRYVLIRIPEYTQEDYIRLLDSPDFELRYTAIANLIKMNVFKLEGLPGAAELPQKIENLLTDASPKVRSIAAFWVKSIKDDTFEKVLIKLSDDPSSSVRLEVISTLGAKYLEFPDAVKAILDRLDDKSTLVRLQAVELLGKCGESTLRDAIVKKLLVKLPEVNQTEQLKIIETLGMIGEGSEVDTVLLGMLSSSEDAIITTAVKALGQQQSASAVKMFPDLILRGLGQKEAIIKALGAIGTPEATQFLIELLNNDGQEEIRIDVIEAIGETEGDMGLKELVRKFYVEEEKAIKEVDSVKWADFNEGFDFYPELCALVDVIAQKIVTVGDEYIEPSIIELLASKDGCERMVGLILSEERGSYDRMMMEPGERPDLFSHLERFTNDPSVFVRALCLYALGNSTDPRVLPILEKAIEDSPFGIRYAAVEALGDYANNVSKPAMGDYADNVSNYAPLRRLYEMKEKFVPKAYTDEDKDFLIRQSIEESITESESEYLTYQRRVSELAGSSTPTRLIAALQLAGKKDKIAIPVLFDFLEKGTTSEQQAALDGFNKFSSASTDVISKLQAIKAKQQDGTLKEEIDKTIKKLQSE